MTKNSFIAEVTFKERFDNIKELTDEINRNYVTYCFKGNTFRKKIDYFNDDI